MTGDTGHLRHLLLLAWRRDDTLSPSAAESVKQQQQQQQQDLITSPHPSPVFAQPISYRADDGWRKLLSRALVVHITILLINAAGLK